MANRVHIGATAFRIKGRRLGSFRPEGALRPNRELWSSSDPVQAARLFVGFNVGAEPMWSLGRVMDLVKEIRRSQGELPDASFVFQRGFYTHEAEVDGQRQLVEEDGAQIIIINTSGTAPKAFEQEMNELGEKLAYAMDQESVIVEFQRGGRTYHTVAMGP